MPAAHTEFFLSAFNTDSTVLESLSLRARIGENVELYCFIVSYLAASPTITVLTPSWMSAYILRARTSARTPTHMC